ncbi:hypothetical protein ACTI_66700 [Actinoplanes sp. OR16]|uniref:DUF6223 family protein n=1 Tax=Actinoplanes sp. OR16 TaxID=946334 RepID=UPI000F6EF8FD|nr:DUF6223 family protein [Actinoplanes sp. OR16]BBH69985.1 hypothetical protein ACTI_66700 [Actinoplanes sp. OR16]
MLPTGLIAASTVPAYSLTGDRVVATTAAVLAVAGVVVGSLAVSRVSRRLSMIALTTGLISAVIGIMVIATADGGPGTGNGIVGGYAAVALGLTAAGLGGLASIRTSRASRGPVR